MFFAVSNVTQNPTYLKYYLRTKTYKVMYKIVDLHQVFSKLKAR